MSIDYIDAMQIPAGGKLIKLIRYLRFGSLLTIISN